MSVASAGMAARPGRGRSNGEDALVDEVAREIQKRILDGSIHVGAWIRQETLAAELGVSRTPIREALRQLQAGGLVEVLPRRGTYVRGPSPRDIREGYAVRAELEGLAAELAAQLITDAELDRLRMAEALLPREVDPDVEPVARSGHALLADSPWVQWMEANDLFHDLIVEASGNRRLRDAIRYVYPRFPRELIWTALSSNSWLLGASAEEHSHIVERIEAHDSAGAREAMVDHIRRAGDFIAHRAEILSEPPEPPR
jgi:DNA-binding GntR family transcriptional regulator